MSIRRIVPILSMLSLVSAPALSGCGSEEESAGGGSAASSEAAAEARSIFQSRCATCHGANGAGDGAAAAGLNPPPANFQQSDWQESVTDEHIERIIVGGGAAVGKSPAMPPNPDLQSKPEVVTALREHIRSLDDLRARTSSDGRDRVARRMPTGGPVRSFRS